MTRLKTTGFALLGWTLALAALGFFASIGLALLGTLALLGLGLAGAAWISDAVAARTAPQDVSL